MLKEHIICKEKKLYHLIELFSLFYIKKQMLEKPSEIIDSELII